MSDAPAVPSRKLLTQPPPPPEGFTPIAGHPGYAFDAERRVASCMSGIRKFSYRPTWRLISKKNPAVKQLWPLIPPRADRAELPPPPADFHHVPDRPGYARNAAGITLSCRNHGILKDPAAKLYRDRWRVVSNLPRSGDRRHRQERPDKLAAAPRPSLPPKPQAEREAMLASVEKLIGRWIREAGVPREEVEDAEQEVKLELWRQTNNFDPSRGVKWSTYASAITRRMFSKLVAEQKCRAEVHPDNWDVFPDPASVGDHERDETADQLYGAVQRQLTAGVLGAITAKAAQEVDPGYLAERGIEPMRQPAPGEKSPGADADAPKAVLSARELVEMVAFDGLTARDIAIQTGQPLKVVKVNLKNAIRTLKNRGLTQHVLPDVEVESILTPCPTKKHANKPKPRQAASYLPPPPALATAEVAGVGQDSGRTPDPAEAVPAVAC